LNAASHSHADSGQQLEVAIIGGGQAGLAIGYYLREQDRRFRIFERESELAPAWRQRWDSLTLFTPRRYSGLPGLGFPGDPDGYPTRDEVIAYLERYADTFELPIEFDSEVKKLERDDEGRFRLTAGDRTITADQIVVATGPFSHAVRARARRQARCRRVPDARGRLPSTEGRARRHVA
jgi:putative flavoprotein involved in K+ transport